ncbi:MAG: hypothetical protein QOG62_15 [Thermoleophilaceae bacterium]|jgi:hypothetical protein|nr:hypothetical protein [Thermoleophilaceae bacterium]
MAAPTSPRFPDVPLKAGHYESFYAKLSDPARPRGLWIRYTVHKAPGKAAHGSVWFTWFDRDAAGPRAAKVTVPDEGLRVPDGGYIALGDSTFTPAGLRGSISVDGLEVDWDLNIDSSQEPYRHLPKPWMYTAGLPKTKLLSPHPGARYSGHATVGGERIEVAGWPGMVGHNWGAQHAERWIWMHGTGFEGHEAEEAWLDGALGRIKVGPWTTPWIGNACLVLDGRRHLLGGPGKLRATKVIETPERCEFTLPGEDIEVHGVLESPRKDIVCWVYADPDGPEHNTANCSIARLTLRAERAGRPPVELATDWGATYELGMRETDHGLPLQPFPDG